MINKMKQALNLNKNMTIGEFAKWMKKQGR